jgi:hypothetical protein
VSAGGDSLQKISGVISPFPLVDSGKELSSEEMSAE